MCFNYSLEKIEDGSCELESDVNVSIFYEGASWNSYDIP